MIAFILGHEPSPGNLNLLLLTVQVSVMIPKRPMKVADVGRRLVKDKTLRLVEALKDLTASFIGSGLEQP